MKPPEHLRGLASYLTLAPRSVDGEMSFAWTFGLVCAAMFIAAVGLAVEVMVSPTPSGSYGIAAAAGAAGALGATWCFRKGRRRLALRRRWSAAASDLAARVGGERIDNDALLAWFVAHWPVAVQYEDVYHSPCAHAIATRSLAIHVEPEGTTYDGDAMAAHLVVFIPRAVASTVEGFRLERVESCTIARLDLATHPLATPEDLAGIAPLVRKLYE